MNIYNSRQAAMPSEEQLLLKSFLCVRKNHVI